MKNKLYNIKSELENIPSREKTFESCIRNRLSRAVDAHSHYVKRICDYLSVRSSIKVLKYANKMSKKKKRG